MLTNRGARHCVRVRLSWLGRAVRVFLQEDRMCFYMKNMHHITISCALKLARRLLFH